MMEYVKAAEKRWGHGLVIRKSLCKARSCIMQEDIAPTAEVIIKLPWTKPPLSLNQRGASQGASFARNAEVKRIKQSVVALATRANLPRKCRYSRVTLHYVPADNRRRDTDNLVATLKVVCDALVEPSKTQPVGYGLVPDDIPEFMAKPEPRIYRHEKGQKPALYLQVEVWEELPESVVTTPQPAPEWLVKA